MKRWCWHNWTPWETYVWRGVEYGSRGYLITGDMTPRQVTRTMQARRCIKCGKELHREVLGASGVTMTAPQPAKSGNPS